MVRLATLVMTSWMALPGGAARPVLLQESADRIPLGPHFEILEDPEGDWTLAQVRSEPLRSRFVASEEEQPTFGFTGSAYWVRFRVVGGEAHEERLLEVDYPHHDDLRLYAETGGELVVRQTGEAYPFKQREVDHRKMLFKLRVLPGRPVDVHVRVQSASSMRLAMTLWRPDAFNAADRHVQFSLGLFFGVMLAAILYNVLLAFALRERAYLLLVGIFGALMLVEMGLTGIAFQYLWPQYPWWSKQSIPFFIAVASLLSVEFARAFLESAAHVPRVDRALRGMVAVNALIALFTLSLGYKTILFPALVLAFVSPGACIVATLLRWRSGYRPARYLGIALAALLAGVVAAVTPRFIGVPINFVTDHGLQVGIAIMAMMATLALGDHVFIVEREKTRAERQAAAAQHAARRRVEALNIELEQLNAELEARVHERTAELERKNEALALIDRRKDDLIATISHDFRSPLAAIRQNVQTVLRDFGSIDTGDLRDLLKGIERQEARLTSMSNHLLDLARLKQGRIERKPVDLDAISAQLVDSFQLRAHSASVRLERVVEDGAPRLALGDAERLGQVVQNLIDNALKFTGAGGRVCVRLARGEDPQMLRFDVEDTGCGVPPDAMARLFEPFYQVPRSSHAGQGSGLGLAIVRAVMDAHGGKVSVRSIENQGTTFSLELAAVPADAAPAPHDQA